MRSFMWTYLIPFMFFSYLLVYLDSMCQYKCMDTSEIEFEVRTKIFRSLELRGHFVICHYLDTWFYFRYWFVCHVGSFPTFLEPSLSLWPLYFAKKTPPSPVYFPSEIWQTNNIIVIVSIMDFVSWKNEEKLRFQSFKTNWELPVNFRPLPIIFWTSNM